MLKLEKGKGPVFDTAANPASLRALLIDKKFQLHLKFLQVICGCPADPVRCKLFRQHRQSSRPFVLRIPLFMRQRCTKMISQ